MNIEDRLREALDREADQLQAPHGSPTTAIRRGRRRRASNLIGGAALVLALVGGTAAGMQLIGSSSEPDPDAVTASQLAPGEESTTQTNQDDVDPAETAVFDWQRIELPLPYAADIWNAQVATIGDGYVAVANAYSEASDLTTITWTSPDGRTWTVADPAGLTGNFDALLSTGRGFVAVSTRNDDDTGVIPVFTTRDGVNWSEGTADLGPLAPNTYPWFTSAASGPETTVLVGTLTVEPLQPPILFPDAGIRLEQDYNDGVLTLYDVDTGALLTRVPTNSLYGDGTVRLYDDAGSVLLEIPQEELDDLVRAESAGATVERDGIRLEIDFDSYSFRATDVATEQIILQGELDQLYQPPRLTVTDPDTGDVLLDVSIDEFYDAEERSYREVDFAPKSSPLVLVSTDGLEWVRAELPIPGGDAEGIEVAGVTYGSEGFVVSVVHYGEDYRVDTLASADGRSWQITDSSDEAGAEMRISWEGAYYTTRPDRSGRSEVARSTDGLTWTTVHQSPSRDAFYHMVAGGEFGLVAVGQGHSGGFGPPLTISKDGRTMTLDYETGRVTVIEDASGETLTDFAFDVFDEDAPAQFTVDDAAGTVTITDDSGTVLMTVTEAEGEAAVAEQERTFGGEETLPYPVVAYSPDGTEWFAATTSGLDMAWAQGVAVGPKGVVIVGESTESYLAEIGSDGSTATTYGTAGGRGGPFIWFGTAR